MLGSVDRPDAESGGTNGHSINLKLGALTAAALATFVFAPPLAGAVSFSRADISMGANSGPSSIAVGLFGGGAQDLAITLADADEVVREHGNGDGTFGSPLFRTTGADGAQVQTVAVGDFNNDGNQDLATGNFDTPNPPNFNNLSIFLGNGAGGFNSGQSYTAGQSIVDIVVGNFNADANLDIVTVNRAAHTVSVSLGNGTGAFPTATQFAAGQFPRGADAADFDGDSDLDLAVTSLTGDNVSILLGDGTGSFGAANPFTVGDAPAGVVTGSFNADVFTDIAVANSGSGNVSVLLGVGNGTFGAASNFATGAGAVAVEKNIFDGDANQDLVVANQQANTVSVLLGSASGTFGAAQNFSVGGFPRSVAVGDFDNVNGRDVATANSTGNSVSVLLDQVTPTVTTQATVNATAGNAISDTATIAGGETPGGTITFTAYGPDDANCTGAAVFTDTETVSGNGDYTTNPAFTPTAVGTYRWRATYSGDPQNTAVSPACNAANETSTVAKATPTLSTQATVNAAFGSPISDTATLAGGASPTGTITFNAYGPSDANCTGAAVFTDTETVSGNGPYTTTPAFTPTAAGTYRWRASYAGDAQNEAVSGLCNAANETSTVAQATPTLSTQATASATMGGPISDTATLTGLGGTTPAGTITFRAYGPNDLTCATVVFTDTEAVSGNGQYTTNPAFIPAAVGNYRWVASYSGDANNFAVTGACGDAGETSTVVAAVVPDTPPTTDTPAAGGMAAPVLPAPTLPSLGLPDNSFRIGPVRSQRLTVRVLSPGSVAISDAAARRNQRRLLSASRASGRAGTIQVPLRLTSAGTRRLRRSGRVTVDARITFTPTAGTARTQTARLRIKGKKRRR